MFYKKAILVVSIGVFFLSIVPFHSYLVALAEFSAQSYLKCLCVTVLCLCLEEITLIDSQVICTASNVGSFCSSNAECSFLFCELEQEQEQHYIQLYLKNHFLTPYLYVIMFLVFFDWKSIHLWLQNYSVFNILSCQAFSYTSSVWLHFFLTLINYYIFQCYKHMCKCPWNVSATLRSHTCG